MERKSLMILVIFSALVGTHARALLEDPPVVDAPTFQRLKLNKMPTATHTAKVTTLPTAELCVLGSA